ncbi:MAG: FtsX-like permease family protein [Actinomycetota bacterium]
MIRLTAKGLWAHRGRFVLTAAGVVVSVGFLAAVLLLTNAMGANDKDHIAAANAGIDAVVRGEILAIEEDGPGERNVVRRALDDGVAATVAATPGVESSAVVVAGEATLTTLDGDRIGGPEQPTVAETWVADPTLSTFTVDEGSPPVGPAEIAVDVATASDVGVDVGDELVQNTPTGSRTVTIAGLLRYGGADGPPTANAVLIDAAAAGDVFGTTAPDRIVVRADDGVDAAAVAAGLTAALTGPVVETGDELIAELQADLDAALSFLSTFLLAFAIVATVAGVTLIHNTFAIAVTQRTRELALLRAVGASRSQVRRSILLEAALVGLVASLVGLAVGIVGVRALDSAFTAIGVELLDTRVEVSPGPLAVAGAVGVLVTLGSAWFSARRASTISPLAALRESAVDDSGTSRLRSIGGIAALGAGLVGVALGVGTGQVLVLGVAMLTTLAAVVVAGPTLASAVARSAGRLGLDRRPEGRLATTNARRNPRRAASTSLALIIGLGLVGFFLTLTSSFAASLAGTVEDSLRADYVVSSTNEERGTIPTDLATGLAAVDGVTSVSPLRLIPAVIDGAPSTLGGIDPLTIDAAYDLGVTAGSFDALGADGVAVHVDEAPGLPLGDELTLELASGATRTLEVVARFEHDFPGFEAPRHLVTLDQLDAAGVVAPDFNVFVSVADEHDVAALGAAVGSASADLRTATAFVAGSGGELDAFRNFVLGLLSLAVVIALAGIANTTTLSIRERTRELGLLRAVGTTARQVRRSVRYEAALVALHGTIVGLGLGVLGAWTLFEVLGDADLTVVSVPVTKLAVVGAGSVVAGTLAAAVPAWMASRVPTLEAVAGG